MTIYDKQVKLLVRVLPEVAKEECFALKGGTAINLFYKNLPRLSVDIDLTYIYFDDRKTAISNIEASMERICLNVNKLGITTEIIGTDSKKIVCSDNFVKIKIEPNYTIRGYAYEPQLMRICEKAEEDFGFAKINVVSKAELYGGKICAALDRQHPRDLFDVKELLDSNELTDDIVKGFVILLLGAGRPLHEMLNPNIIDQSQVFQNEFYGMSDKEFTYDNHIETLKTLVDTVNSSIKTNYKDFLLDFVRLEHKFSDVDIPNLDKLPAIMWKVRNLEKLRSTNKAKFEEQAEKLIKCFE